MQRTCPCCCSSSAADISTSLILVLYVAMQINAATVLSATANLVPALCLNRCTRAVACQVSARMTCMDCCIVARTCRQVAVYMQVAFMAHCRAMPLTVTAAPAPLQSALMMCRRYKHIIGTTVYMFWMYQPCLCCYIHHMICSDAPLLDISMICRGLCVKPGVPLQPYLLPSLSDRFLL